MKTSVFFHNVEFKVGVAVERYIAVYHPLYYNKVEIFKLLLNVEDVLLSPSGDLGIGLV